MKRLALRSAYSWEQQIASKAVDDVGGEAETRASHLGRSGSDTLTDLVRIHTYTKTKSFCVRGGYRKQKRLGCQWIKQPSPHVSFMTEKYVD